MNTRFIALAASLLLLLSPATSQAQYSVLYSFGDPAVTGAGSMPYGNLVLGTDGNFYGTTEFGGTAGFGAIYKMTPGGVVTLLHSFKDGSVAEDGIYPYSGLIQAKDGNFYGTTLSGGTGTSGTIYKMTPAGVVTILHNFHNTFQIADGASPRSSLIQGKDGNFYGTTHEGGTGGYGTVFKMTPAGALTLLHNFPETNNAEDGKYPVAPLVQGTDGILYGTTFAGGKTSQGTIFSITTTGTTKILHHFADGTVASDGTLPQAALMQDLDGTFYGLTSGGGTTGLGTYYKITPAGTYNLIRSFSDGSIIGDPRMPYAGLHLGLDGFFYGATPYDYTNASTGVVFKISRTGLVTPLHSFVGNTAAFDGFFPYTGVIQAPDGAIYGTTSNGGKFFSGTIYKYSLPVPPAHAPVISGAKTASGAVAKAFSYQVTASDSPYNYGATSMPNGVSINATTGLISGTPGIIGKYNVLLTATNGRGTGTYTLILTVAPGTQTISIQPVPDQVVGAKATLYANATSGLPVTYTLASGPATLAGRVLTFTGAGAVTVRANQAGNTNYKAAKQVTTSVVVKKKPQYITFPVIPTKVLGVAPFKLTAKSSSGLALVYTVSGPAKISGSTLTITGTGNVLVTAAQAGNGTYAAAVAVKQRFLVTSK